MRRRLTATVALAGLCFAPLLVATPAGAEPTPVPVATNESEPAAPTGEEGAVAPAGEENPEAEAERMLLEENFDEGAANRWVTHTAGASTIEFRDSRAWVKGGGPENRLLSRSDLLAHDLTMDVDFYIHEGHTNAALKFGFFGDSQGASRFQLNIDGPHSLVRLEKVTNGQTERLAEQREVAFPANTAGPAHRVQIQVRGETINVLREGKSIITATDASIGAARDGRVLVASQYPKQDYSVDRIRVTTPEKEQTGTYSVTTKTRTDGKDDTDPATAGGTLSANRSSGNHGDEVSLTVTTNPGYVFEGYDSYLAESGNSTDGLLTIKDDKFTLNDKTGSVIIVAKFKTAPVDPGTIFLDRFNGEMNDHGLYTFSSPDAARIEGGALVVDPKDAVASVLLDASKWEGVKNYAIEMDAKKANATRGTIQIGFRLANSSDCYVLALNGERALIRRLASDGTNVELASVLYTFDQTYRRLVIDVSDNTVSVSDQRGPIVSYTNTDSNNDKAHWSSWPPGLGIWALTPGAPVTIDNLQVTRATETLTVTTEVYCDGELDADFKCGSLDVEKYLVTAGGELKFTPIVKGGYALEKVTVNGQEVTDGTYQTQVDASGELKLKAYFVTAPHTARTLYVDSVNGDDSRSGDSPETARRSLPKEDEVFGPGDAILLRRGSEFRGEAAHLKFSGSGSAEAPIRVGTYGEGARPVLAGEGAVTDVVETYNQENLVIEGLEITNQDPGYEASFGLNTSNNRTKQLRAVRIKAKDFGVVHNITLQDLYIHHVNGNIAVKWNGGIFFDAGGSVEDGALRGVPTKYDNVLITKNRIEKVDRSGIKLVGSTWANQSLENSPSTPLNWYPSTNVVVRDNVIRYCGGDGITVRDTEGALVEGNLVHDSRYQDTGYNAGVWPFQATNTVVQHNEVAFTHGVQDGQGLDTDHVSSYSVMQYNYSHDNEGGFMLIMNGFPHTAPTIRYNISQNDADKTFEFARGTAAGTMIYNNTIHSDSVLVGPRSGVLDLANSKAGTGNREVFISNNIFSYPQGQTFYVGEADTMKTKAKLYNNAYIGGIAVPAEEENALTGDMKLPGLGTAPKDSAQRSTPVTGLTKAEAFAGYVPADDSPLVNAGKSVEEIIAHFGGTNTDRRTLTPTAIHEQAKAGHSIDFVAGKYLPEVAGVDYTVDFLGNPLPDATAEKPGALAKAWRTVTSWFRSSTADEGTPATGEGDAGLTVGAVQVGPVPAPSPDPTMDPTPAPQPTPDPTDRPILPPVPQPTVSPDPSVPAVPVDPSGPETPSKPGTPGEPGTAAMPTAPGSSVEAPSNASLPVTGMSGLAGLVALMAGLTATGTYLISRSRTVDERS